jgi:hypothetical protein
MGARLEEIVEHEDWLGEIQGGFRRKRGTTDNLFVITELMDQAKKKKKPLYMAFVDLRKAYDTVWRGGLWSCLEKKGLGGKFLNIVKELYKDHSRRVRTVGGMTDWIRCNKGVKQGCVLSPMLFALYVADIGERMQENMKGVHIGNIKVSGLFFADDLIVFAESERDLRDQLGLLHMYTTQKRLQINFAKTEIMKMNTGRTQTAIWEMLDTDGKVKGVIQECNIFKYLGVRLGKNRRFVYQMQHLKRSIRRKVGMTKLRAREAIDPQWAAEVIWENIMKPGLLYGAEIIIDTKEVVRVLERAQNNIGRWITGTSCRAASCGIRAEMGWTTM